MTLFRSLAWRMMARDARASGGRFLFVILAVAAGVGALTGVRGFSEAFRETLLREARTLMAADLAVRSFTPATPQQEQALNGLVRQGVERTTVIETVSMLSPASGNPIMVSLKAVDPARYPFYGQIQLDPDVPLAQALTPNTVAVSFPYTGHPT